MFYGIAELIEKKSYEEIFTLMAKDGVLTLPESKSWFFRRINTLSKKITYRGIVSRGDWQYLKDAKTAYVHRDNHPRVQALIIQHLEECVQQDRVFRFIASSIGDDAGTLYEDFINTYGDQSHRPIQPMTYQGYISELLYGNKVSPSIKNFINRSKK